MDDLSPPSSGAAALDDDRVLTLVALSERSIRALYAGEPDWAAEQPELAVIAWPDDDRRVLRYRVAALDADPASAPWLLHAAVLDGTLVGRIGCHEGPDDTGQVEIGYAVRPELRGRGLAGRIVDAFLDWVTDRGVVAVRATVRPDNAPSRRILDRRGFVEVGESWDEEDGLELVLVKRFDAP